MPHRAFPAVDALIHQVQSAAADCPDPTLILAELIRVIGEREADPYLVLGVLLEGAAHTLAKRVPPERQADTAAAMVQLLRDRLKASGLT